MNPQKFISLFLIVCVGPACNSSPPRIAPIHLVETTGLYEAGLEPQGFRLCADSTGSGIWRPVEFAPGIIHNNWPYTRTNDQSRVVTLVQFRGLIDPPEKRGAIIWPGRVHVKKVLGVRAPHRGDCGWEGK